MSWEICLPSRLDLILSKFKSRGGNNRTSWMKRTVSTQLGCHLCMMRKWTIWALRQVTREDRCRSWTSRFWAPTRHPQTNHTPLCPAASSLSSPSESPRTPISPTNFQASTTLETSSPSLSTSWPGTPTNRVPSKKLGKYRVVWATRFQTEDSTLLSTRELSRIQLATSTDNGTKESAAAWSKAFLALALLTLQPSLQWCLPTWVNCNQNQQSVKTLRTLWKTRDGEAATAQVVVKTPITWYIEDYMMTPEANKGRQVGAKMKPNPAPWLWDTPTRSRCQRDSTAWWWTRREATVRLP